MRRLKLDNVQRSRLKVTTAGITVLFVASLFPTYIIYLSVKNGSMDNSSAWAAWSSMFGTMGMLIGYYVNKETNRPSFINKTYVGNTNNGEILEENYTDPENIPL